MICPGISNPDDPRYDCDCHLTDMHIDDDIRWKGDGYDSPEDWDPDDEA